MEPNVKTFMTATPISIEADTPAMAALDLMIDHGIRHLVVVDKLQRIRGVISINDLRAALPLPVNLKVPPSVDRRLEVPDMLVGEIMTYAPITLNKEAPLDQAVSRMLEGRFGCLPVVDENGRVDGILTETDLLQALATMLWTTRERSAPPPPDDIIPSLERERVHLVKQLEQYEQQVQSSTRVRRETPMDIGEVGHSTEEGLLTEQLAELCSRRLRSIEHAIERAERGTFEVCERCGENIPKARLRALPGTTICIRCARESEQLR
jgi:CBS domain-containing protein/RNA polymerase-binding transcription factor DksA